MNDLTPELRKRHSPSDAAARLEAMVEKLYPSLNETERSVAVTNLLRYFEIALTVTEELEDERLQLTPDASLPTMEERSKSNMKS